MALIKVQATRGSSDFVVHEVKSSIEADLLVRLVDSQGPAHDQDGIWHLVPTWGLATSRICYSDYGTNADLKVYFVNTSVLAGWRHEHPLKGKL